jgi:uncharacterized membrane protein YdjX (TVP38/TMEM64 family)
MPHDRAVTSPPADVPSNTSTVRRWLPLLAIAGLTAIVFGMGWHRQLTFENFALQRGTLDAFVKANLSLAVLSFMAIYIAIVALSLPGAGVLTIAGGLLFGVWLAVPATVVAATIGAILIFLIARSSIGAALAERAGPWLDRFRDGFEKEGIAYMLFLRLVPFPFFIINLVPAVLGVPLRTFAIGTLFGIIPATFAFSYLGDTLDRVITDARTAYDACVAAKSMNACNLTIELGMLPIKQILISLTLLGLVALIPPALKKWRARNAAL